MFFRIPFLSNYYNNTIMSNLEKETLQMTNKNRLEMFIKFSDYFEHEMRYGQRISLNPIIQLSVTYSILQKNVVFILIYIINLFFIFDMRLDANGKHLEKWYSIYEVIHYMHFVLSYTCVVVEMIERYPFLAYFKGMILEKKKP